MNKNKLIYDLNVKEANAHLSASVHKRDMKGATQEDYIWHKAQAKAYEYARKQAENLDEREYSKVYFPEDVASYVNYINDSSLGYWYPFDIIGEIYEKIKDEEHHYVNQKVKDWIQENEEAFVEGIINGFDSYSKISTYSLVSKEDDHTFVCFDNKLNSEWANLDYSELTYKTKDYEEILAIKSLIETKEGKDIEICEEEVFG